jgi:hypothetical protein
MCAGPRVEILIAVKRLGEVLQAEGPDQPRAGRGGRGGGRA